MEKVIVIGKTGSGKTTLIQKLESLEITYKKTQVVENYPHFIDTPGEYLENRSYYRALMVTSADADVIAFVEDCSNDEIWLQPMFSLSFSKEVIGIVTKIDLAKSPEDIENAVARLKMAGSEKIFRISSIENEGIQELSEYLNK